MKTGLDAVLLRLTSRRRRALEPAPLLVELFGRAAGKEGWSVGSYPFSYRVTSRDSVPFYEVACNLPSGLVMTMRKAVSEVSLSLDPREVDPLTFHRLIEVLTQHSAERLASYGVKGWIRELSELAAYEAIGLSRILALARDDRVTEFFVDSDLTPVYLDHTVAGRCESGIVLTERERSSLETHVDTFSGYTLDFKTPSLKNDLLIGGAILRVSLDLEPVSVNRFALDVRRLNVSSMSLPQLISLGVLSGEAAALLVGWLESGGNVTIVGETGTGKTTLLNALDEQVERRLRRLYIEDAVETRDMLDRGYHQMKVKVDPFERGDGSGRTKESEIVKALHRSPDIVILSEIQSEEHSRAFFQALASGARGIQTFHASTVEQAIRRWVNMHHIAEQSLLDLGLMVQMTRPDRLKQGRYVQRVCAVVREMGVPKLKELLMRDRDYKLRNVAGPGWPLAPDGVESAKFQSRVALAFERVKPGGGIEG
ncbi:MAG: type II/IV secretion system ATPase subunit [Nitrososphaerota archaeon]|nr:type II/IV secretion system ATPase subunit [Nitrososphaerota archaeon]